jgi:hypothetical protein
MRKLIALAMIALALASGVAVYNIEKPAPRRSVQQQRLLKPPHPESNHMHKLLALALLALAVAGGVAVYSLEKPAPAAACTSANC